MAHLTSQPANVVSAVARIIVGILALGVATGALVTYGPVVLLTFTVQSNLMLGATFLWTAWALLQDRRTPPEWLAGSAVYYVAITGLVYNVVLNPGSFRVGNYLILGLTGSDIAHVIVPIAAVVIWLVLAEHRRVPWRYIGLWLLYLVAYLVVIVVLMTWVPGVNAPYPFLDIRLLGWGAVLRTALELLVAFAAVAAAFVATDRMLLPARTRFSEFDRHDQVA